MLLNTPPHVPTPAAHNQQTETNPTLQTQHKQLLLGYSRNVIIVADSILAKLNLALSRLQFSGVLFYLVPGQPQLCA
jgi:hypothetical protein